jgi:hypothetical protein
MISIYAGNNNIVLLRQPIFLLHIFQVLQTFCCKHSSQSYLFTYITCSVHLYKRKKRLYWYALPVCLLCLSCVMTMSLSRTGSVVSMHARIILWLVLSNKDLGAPLEHFDRYADRHKCRRGVEMENNSKVPVRTRCR